MLIAGFCFFIDFLFYSFLHQWVIHTLLAYFILIHCVANSPKLSSADLYSTCFLLLIQDFFLYGRFGLCLITVVPAILIADKFQRVLIRPTLFFPLFLTAIILIESLIVKKLALGQDISFFMTITKILITIGSGYVGLIGLRSNRSFLPTK